MKFATLIGLGVIVLGLADVANGKEHPFESAIEGKTYSGLLDGRMVKFTTRHGVALMEGCIALGDAQSVLDKIKSQYPNGKSLSGSPVDFNHQHKGLTLGNRDLLWPKNSSGVVEVPYIIDTDPDNKVPAAITAANLQLQGFMQWVARTNQTDFVAFNLTEAAEFPACFSQVGRVGGRQNIGGSRGCGTGVLVHEMGHAVGMWHEQQRDDRNRWLRINTENVDPSYVGNYDPIANTRDIGGHDYGSIMHYANYGFTKIFRPALESIPAGIRIGARDRYSEADIEAMRRLYDSIDTLITITSFPSGLNLIVDGATVVTPAQFNWPIGSVHTVSAPEGVSTVADGHYTFARWSNDSTANLQRTQTITINGGDGRLGFPSNKPSVNTFTAYFAYLVEVRTGSNVAGGTTLLSPEPETIAGASGRYWRENIQINNRATAPNGFQFVRWGPTTGLFHYPAASNRNTNPHQAPVAIGPSINIADWTANFSDQAQVFIRMENGAGNFSGNNFIDRIDVTPVAAVNVPEVTWTWNDAETRRFKAKAVVDGLTPNIRSKFLNWTGGPTLASPDEIQIAKPVGPLSASTTYTARYLKQFKAFSDVENRASGNCGFVNLSPLPGAEGFYDYGTNLTATYSPPAGFQIIKWNGNVVPVGSSTSSSAQFFVNDIADARPEININAERFSIENVTPNIFARDANVLFEITGSGFTSGTEVYVADIRRSANLIAPNRLLVSIPLNQMPPIGKAVVALINRAGNCSVGTFSGVDFKAENTVANVQPKTGWWWNPAESGRGFFIERQNNSVFMSAYYYEADGRPTWFIAAGSMTGNRFDAPAQVVRGGQSLFSDYIAPGAPTTIGNVSIDFNSPTNASMTWPGGLTSISDFAYGGSGGIAAENGWWWNPSESGRGYSIEVQGNSLFFVSFMYDESGNPFWYLSSGAMQSANRFVGSLQTFRAGQTLTGPYQAPSPSTSFGNITIDFTDATNGRITFPGGRQVPITRFRF